MKEDGFKLVKERSRRYLAQTITGTDYADDIALLANSPGQTKSLLHSLERTGGGMSTQTKQNTYALVKEVTPPPKRVVL